MTWRVPGETGGGTAQVDCVGACSMEIGGYRCAGMVVTGAGVRSCPRGGAGADEVEGWGEGREEGRGAVGC